MDRIRHSVLLLLCISYVSTMDPNFEEIHSSTDSNESNDSEILTAVQTYRHPRVYRRGYYEEHDSMFQDDHHDQEEENAMQSMSKSKVDYWGGYYDFLINEGSYKFWAVFQLATAALLIYSGFAALYYAKVNPPTTDDEFDDILRRRKRRDLSIFPTDKSFCGLDSATFQRIIDAVAREIH
ncbi:uncharacterized protein LOC114874883 [Osmia bicornis bicornis]|uniref:uncharacterized protein LOC114874883 n=1 Tax=Osmia bicornis bicornis TaxID=1437191 RepID=UPI001EAE9635|nr:uncharacterized protein LOC114874883 [Osmia bicornis bicornis]